MADDLTEDLAEDLTDQESTQDYVDTEDELDLHKGRSASALSDCSGSDSENELYSCFEPKHVEELKPELQCVLPEGTEFSYLVESYQALPQHTFCGAPVANFEAHVRVNLDDEADVKNWIDSLSKKTKCTYRVSCTYKPTLKRVTYKIDMHCQHFRKPLTKRQQQVHNQVKKKTPTLLSSVNCKKTECPSTLKITIQKPPKTKVAKHHDTHKAAVKLVFHHNHPVNSAHVLGFRPVAEET